MSGISLNNSNIKMAKLLDCFVLDKTDGIPRSCTVQPFDGIRATLTSEPRWRLNLSLFNDPTVFLKIFLYLSPFSWSERLIISKVCLGRDLLWVSFGGAEGEKNEEPS